MRKDKYWRKNIRILLKYGPLATPFVLLISWVTSVIISGGITNAYNENFNSNNCERIIPYFNIRDVPNVPKKLVYRGGSTSVTYLWKSIVKKDDKKDRLEDKINEYSSLEFKYIEPKDENPGSNTGVKMILANEFKPIISFSSEYMTSLPAYINQSSSPNIQLEDLEIASDSVVFYVSTKSNIKSSNNTNSGLTMKELEGILGSINNWTEKSSSSIKIYTRDTEASGTVEFIQRKFLEDKDIKLLKENKSMDKNEKRDTTFSIRAVAADPNGIGFATAGEVCSQRIVKVLSVDNVDPCTKNEETNHVNLSALENNTYPKKLTRSLFVIYNPANQLSKKAGIAYCYMARSWQGRDIVKQAGLLPK